MFSMLCPYDVTAKLC